MTVLPICEHTSPDELVSLLLLFYTDKGYQAFYRVKLEQFSKPAAAFEATEILFQHFFGHRRYSNPQTFFDGLNQD